MSEIIQAEGDQTLLVQQEGEEHLIVETQRTAQDPFLDRAVKLVKDAQAIKKDAKDSETKAIEAAKEAKESEKNTKASEIAAKDSETKAKKSADSATSSEKTVSNSKAAITRAESNAVKAAGEATTAAKKTAEAIVYRGVWQTATNSFPKAPDTNSLYKVSGDSTQKIGGLDWFDGDYLLFIYAGGVVADQVWSKLNAVTASGTGSKALEIAEDLILNPNKAVRFKKSDTDTDPTYGLGFHVSNAPGKSVRRLLLGDKDRAQQTEINIVVGEDELFIVPNLGPAPDWEPQERIPVLHEKNGISKKKGGTAEAAIRCTVEPKSDQDLTTKSYVDKGNKKIKDELLDEEWRIYAQTETDLAEIRDRNLNQFAASGNVHMGAHHHNGSNIFSINEGLYSYTAEPNVLHMGRDAGVASLGTSKAPFPVTHIAGIISDLVGINKGTANTPSSVQIKFEDAPDGTEVYDSTGNARGLGKAVLNLKQDIDPKYNDVAQDANEARARAFEGYLKNGDFRHGVTDWKGTRGAKLTANSDGSLSVKAGSATAGSGASQLITNKAVIGQSYTVGVYVKDLAKGQIARVSVNDSADLGNGTWSADRSKKKSGYVHITFKAKTKVLYLHLAAQNNNGLSATYHSAFARPSSEQVVINRVDMYGFEYWLEEVTKAQPHVFPKGCIQSKASTMNGIPTTVSNRPSTYFDVYQFDSDSDGKGVDFFALSTDDKKKILSDKSNNIFLLSDGRLVQWRVRQRTFKGIGNGDWRNVSSVGVGATTGDQILNWDSSNRVKAQGGNDSPMTGSTGYYTGFNLKRYNDNPQLGVFTARNPTNVVNGECYFRVSGVVCRINQGAYHHSLNPLGSGKFGNYSRADSQNVDDTRFWYNSFRYSYMKPLTKDDCFRVIGSSNSKKPGSYNPTQGTVAVNRSGRPDGRFHDVIYSSGIGGVTDFRMSAWDMGSKEEAAKVFQKVVNGKYRGLEKLVRTKVWLMEDIIQKDGVNKVTTSTITKNGTTAAELTKSGYNGYRLHFASSGLDTQAEFNRGLLRTDANRSFLVMIGDNGKTHIERGVWHFCYDGNRTYLEPILPFKKRDDAIAALDAAFPTGTNITFYCIDAGTHQVDGVYQTEQPNVSVSGDFQMTDVMGPPDEILNTHELADGWLGGWAGLSGVQYQSASRKNSDSKNVTATYTDDNGKTWKQSPWGFRDTQNQFDGTLGKQYVGLMQYTAFAKQTKPSLNMKVLNSFEGLGNVWAGHHYNHSVDAFFIEGLLSKVPTGTDTGSQSAWGHYALTKPNLEQGGSTVQYSKYNPEHQPINLVGSQGAAVKALWSQASNKQQATLQFNWNELVWGGFKSSIVNLVSGTRQEVEKGDLCRFPNTLNNLAMRDALVLCINDLSHLPTDSWYENNFFDHDGNLVDFSGGVSSAFRKVTNMHYPWGDDSTIRIKGNGVGLYENLNGDSCLFGTSELAIPYGFTKNKARSGEQLAGVDL